MRPICAAAIALSMFAMGCTREPAPKKTAADVATEASTPETLSAKADIPIYPDATLPEKLSNVRTDGQQTRYEIVMVTDDSPQKVSDYYVEKLKLQSKPQGPGLQLMGLTPKGNYAILNVAKGTERTKIVAVSVEP